ncbi:DBH-like monooxygenase protein 2 homolog [Folsomia candida]|uniref:DBH-like monooxygenase protein 2 homolog n=1 Tax=Folsomia candida TaxID=158441 RepID=UPI000B8F5E36|nr:DBH-like monooxygenase protein 2 homolog [Folsomia candida]
MRRNNLSLTLITSSLTFLFLANPLILQINSVNIPPSSLLTLQNQEQLDGYGNVLLAWEYDESSQIISFELEVATEGFVGFGISPSGSMTGADIFIGGVLPNGTAYGADYIGLGNFSPKLDDHQDWTLLCGMEALGKTYIKFSRLINTCDDEDYPIGNDTTRLIWSYGLTDDIRYHTAQRRGSKAGNFIGTPNPQLELDALSKWEIMVDMVMPSSDTTYWCSFHKAPVVMTKHHVVAFDALLDGLDAIAHTHHFILKNCYVPRGSNKTLDQVFRNYTVDTGFMGAHCYNLAAIVPTPEFYCAQYLFVWAKGGKIMTFPENVGYPIGEGDDAGQQFYYMLEIHYDNPDKKEGVQFKAGVQFYYTNETRQEDAGLLAVGHETDFMFTIPPNISDFTLIGQCGPECTNWGIKEKEGVTIFNVLLHAHISGRKLRLRHFRGNLELPWIDYDDHYDFNYQQSKAIPNTKLFPGDRLIYECTYSSTWNNGKAVVSGLSSRNGMGLTFFWHYPRQDMDSCYSQTPFMKHIQDFGITKLKTVPAPSGYLIMIEEPEYLRGEYTETISLFHNWTAEFIEQYQYNQRFLPHENGCNSQKTGEGSYTEETSYPVDYVAYVPKDICSPETGPTDRTMPTGSASTTTMTAEVR